MTPPTPDIVCEHGSLRRSCERCDDAAEIARLREQVRLLSAECDLTRKWWFGTEGGEAERDARRAMMKARAATDAAKALETP